LGGSGGGRRRRRRRRKKKRIIDVFESDVWRRETNLRSGSNRFQS